MAIKKFCRCGKIILKKDVLCIDCKRKLYRDDKAKRKDFNRNKFYSTVEWIKTRNSVRKRDRYICKYCYEFHKELMVVECVHHIIDYKEDDSLKLDKSNLISVCNECHRMIHIQYESSEKDKKKMQDKLNTLIPKSL